MARRAGGKVAKRRRRSERIWTSTSTDASESVLPVADSARFCRRVRMQSNGPHASKSEADGVEAERERQPCEWLCKYAGSAHTGAVWSRRISSCASRGVQSAMLWHCMYMSREDSAHELENPEVRGRDGIANQSGPIGFSHEFTASSSTFPSSIAEQVHNTSRKLVTLSSSSSHRQSCSSWKITFHPFFFITKATPRFALIH
jgi:hypothetical protein